MDEEAKRKEYREYIDNHVNNVKKCYNFYGREACERLNVNYDLLGRMVNNHDKSKYDPEEFDGYRLFFYPTDEELNDPDIVGYRKAKFDSAWLHHLRNNPHHPEFWVHTYGDNYSMDCAQMDNAHIIEMLLDWAAMGIIKGDTAYEYWNKEIDTKPFNRRTIDIIDNIIDIFAKEYTEDEEE